MLADKKKRLRLRMTGTIQGVGFRPTVFRVAHACQLTGWVQNDHGGVTCEIQGTDERLGEFLRMLPQALPPLAVITSMNRESMQVVAEEASFCIRSSPAESSSPASADVTPDAAVCEDCLREFSDPADRRYHYGLINCTNCGPRFSIIQSVPYDRANTTMAAFPLCPQCQAEFDNPADRRFHAQPTCCPVCGPRVWYGPSTHAKAPAFVETEPFVAAARLILEGRILAVKGLGGFHLACRADHAAVVETLRRRKRRESKPFAIMVRNVHDARLLVHLSDPAAAELCSCGAPVVLAARRVCIEGHVAPCVAPDTHLLGLMLPYTPMHVGLFAAIDKLGGDGSPRAILMTSGNLTDEPIATDNDEAQVRLAALADGFLLHERPIERSVDDSVFLDATTHALPVRRSRGHAPVAISLGASGVISDGLALGGELKNTVAVVRNGKVLLSQHLGDLTNAPAFEHFQQAIQDMLQLFHVHPKWLAHDLHPSYLSTQHARTLSQVLSLPLVGVQHHFAHAAGVLAEHDVLHKPALAVVCDGTGLGEDHTIWGGEVLLLKPSPLRFQRVAHLPPIRLPGGDAAARDTRRPGLALLHWAYGGDFENHAAAIRLVPDDADRLLLATMIRKGTNSPWASSAGRYFDGVAALLGVCLHNHHEAQAGMKLEMLARARADSPTAAAGCDENAAVEMVLAKFVCALAEQPNRFSAECWAWMFHDTLARFFAEHVWRAAESHGVQTVALSGGVFCNRLFADLLRARLAAGGLEVLEHRCVPPTDAGLAYGQAAVAGQGQGSGNS